MSAVYYTSDLHFGHQSVAVKWRGYPSVDAHDEALIQTWEEYVSPRDIVYVLGDISGGSSEDRALKILSGLPGRKRLIIGNHDSCHPMHRLAHRNIGRFHMFEYAHVAAQRRIQTDKFGPIKIMLSHFPYSGDHSSEDRYPEWRPVDVGGWLLHGHTHSPFIRQPGGQIHVGWDAWGRPVNEGEILSIISSVLGTP